MENYSNPKASAQHRLGGRAVDGAMYLVTFGIGWFIWSMVVWGQGQTPGKQILKMRVYDKTTGKPAKWGQMAIREFLLPLAMSVAVLVPALIVSMIHSRVVSLFAIIFIYVGIFVIHITDAVWIFRGTAKNRLVDLIAKTDVLNEAPN